MLGHFSEESLAQFVEQSRLERCPAGFWRYPSKTGVCTPVASVEAQMEQAANKRNRQIQTKKNLERMRLANDKGWVTEEEEQLLAPVQRNPDYPAQPKQIIGILTSSGKVIILSD